MNKSAGVPGTTVSNVNIQAYRDVMEIESQSTDDFLFYLDIQKDENWFFGPIDREYALRDQGIPTNTIAQMLAIVHPADRKALTEDLDKIAKGEKDTHNMNYRWINRRGEVVWINCRGKVITDENGKPLIMIGRVSEETLRHLYNPLTGLWNTRKMREDMREKLETPSGYLMLLDIDGLSAINLRYGRKFGDALLKEIADLLESIPSITNAYHIEHNNFGAVIDAESEKDVQAVFMHIQQKMQAKCTFTASAVPINSELLMDETGLFDSAKLTLNKAKQKYTDKLEFFSAEEIEQKIQTLALLDELQESVQNDFAGFELYYQPQVKAGNYSLEAMEVLLRYRSKTEGRVFPDVFIPLLEQSHLIGAVGLWVLERALLQCKQWRKAIPELRVSVNFSIVQFEDSHLAEKVIDILKQSGMPGDALTMEITESIKMHEDHRFYKAVRLLKSYGVQLAIDDFGTGYSNFRYLKQIDVDEVKIDRLFVSGIEEDTYNHKLICNIIDFAKMSDIRICCEGVESARELAVLEAQQPDLFQGYLFDKPGDASTIEKAYIDSSTEEYKRRVDFIQKLYDYKEKTGVIHFNPKDILRANDIGLWIIRISEQGSHYEMHADDTMERILAVDRKYTPQECYAHWYDRIAQGHCDYVQEHVRLMIESGKAVQLEYPWNHPVLGEVMVRCSGKRVDDADGMIVLEGYHRILRDVAGI